MISRVTSYALSPTKLATLGEARLSMLSSEIAVAGVPLDLVRFVREHDGIAIKELLARFDLPGLLTHAFVRRGLESGVFDKDANGLHCRAEYPPPLASLGEAPLLAADVGAARRIMCIDLSEIACALVRAGAPVSWHVRTDDSAALPEPALPGGTSDWFSIRGVHFAAFDLLFLRLDPILVAAQVDTVRANLAPHAHAYLALPKALAPDEEQALRKAVREELWVSGTLSWGGERWLRAVCYPELFGPTEYFEYYAGH